MCQYHLVYVCSSREKIHHFHVEFIALKTFIKSDFIFANNVKKSYFLISLSWSFLRYYFKQSSPFMIMISWLVQKMYLFVKGNMRIVESCTLFLLWMLRDQTRLDITHLLATDFVCIKDELKKAWYAPNEWNTAY